MLKHYLHKIIDSKHTRYYKLSMFLTLFGEYLVQREYGNITYKAPSGKRVDYFMQENKALKFYNGILRKKIKRGYIDYGA